MRARYFHSGVGTAFRVNRNLVQWHCKIIVQFQKSPHSAVSSARIRKITAWNINLLGTCDCGNAIGTRKIHLKMAILSKEGFEVDVFLKIAHTTITLAPKPIFHDEKENTSESQLHNTQLKVVWRTKSEKVTN